MHGDITYGRLAPIMLLKLLISNASEQCYIYLLPILPVRHWRAYTEGKACRGVYQELKNSTHYAPVMLHYVQFPFSYLVLINLCNFLYKRAFTK